jgi:polysaccharide pyruvyl transferase WcaK-like protein
MVAVNVMPMYSSRYWCVHDSSRYERYLDTLACFSAELIRQDYPLFFWGTQHRDEEAINDLLDLLAQQPGIEVDPKNLVRTNRSVDGLMKLLDSADITVPTRFHGTVLSLLANKGVVAIAYYRKTDDLMREFGQAGFSLEFDTLTSDEMLARLYALEANLGAVQTEIARKAIQYRQALNDQYGELFGPIS